MKLPKLDSRGGRGRGSGRARGIQIPTIHRGSSAEVAGIFPFSVGAGVPSHGCPLGQVEQREASLYNSNAILHGDPISWFRHKIISNPSRFILGLPGLGKSTVIRRSIIWDDFTGVIPWVLGDLKPDYVDLIQALGGKVMSLGRKVGILNVLDMSAAQAAYKRIKDAAAKAGDPERARKLDRMAETMMAAARARRHIAITGLLAAQRGTVPTDLENSLLLQAMTLIDRNWARSRKINKPILADLLEMINPSTGEPAKELRKVANDRGSLEHYYAETRGLVTTLTAICLDGGLGDLFNGQTTEHLDWSKPGVIDLSAIDSADAKLKGAALIISWAYGFGQIGVAHTLADAGLEPARNYHVVMDELWDALRTAEGMVDQVDALGRLNRTKGVGVDMISHSMSDLDAMPSESDRAKAEGLVARCGMVMIFGSPPDEIPKLSRAVKLSEVEAERLIFWSSSESWVPPYDGAPPPGQGRFLVKAGSRPGIPCHLDLTPIEMSQGFNDTNKRWAAS